MDRKKKREWRNTETTKAKKKHSEKFFHSKTTLAVMVVVVVVVVVAKDFHLCSVHHLVREEKRRKRWQKKVWHSRRNSPSGVPMAAGARANQSKPAPHSTHQGDNYLLFTLHNKFCKEKELMLTPLRPRPQHSAPREVVHPRHHLGTPLHSSREC